MVVVGFRRSGKVGNLCLLLVASASSINVRPMKLDSIRINATSCDTTKRTADRGSARAGRAG